MSLTETRPDIAAQWHPTKNGDLRPCDVKCFSTVTIWWLCQCCSHEWESKLTNRCRYKTQSYGCKDCNKLYGLFIRSKPKTFEESLEYIHPDLSKQWHPTENMLLGFDVFPKDFTPSSKLMATWICPNTCEYGCEHIWKAAIKNRTINESGCPWCCNRNVCKHESFAWRFPDLYEKLWDKKQKLSGYEVSPKSGQKARFICPKCKKSNLCVISGISNGQGCCLTCGGKEKKTDEFFIQQVYDLYNGKYIVRGEYINTDTHIKFWCTEHKQEYEQIPKQFLKGCIGCTKCQPCGWSRVARDWIESVESAEGIHIQHAPREHEKVIEGYKVDGWCEETKTIYEFHGDYWHGNPKKYQWRMDEKNLSNGKTFGQLYFETCKKTQSLRALGYRVIEKWET